MLPKSPVAATSCVVFLSSALASDPASIRGISLGQPAAEAVAELQDRGVPFLEPLFEKERDSTLESFSFLEEKISHQRWSTTIVDTEAYCSTGVSVESGPCSHLRVVSRRVQSNKNPDAWPITEIHFAQVLKEPVRTPTWKGKIEANVGPLVHLVSMPLEDENIRPDGPTEARLWVRTLNGGNKITEKGVPLGEDTLLKQALDTECAESMSYIIAWTFHDNENIYEYTLDFRDMQLQCRSERLRLRYTQSQIQTPREMGEIADEIDLD